MIRHFRYCPCWISGRQEARQLRREVDSLKGSDAPGAATRAGLAEAAAARQPGQASTAVALPGPVGGDRAGAA